MANRISPRALLRIANLRRELAELEARHGLDRVPPSVSDDEVMGVGVYRLVAEHASDMISIHAMSGAYLFMSPACTRMLGWRPEELIGRSGYTLIHPEDIPRVSALHSEMSTGDPPAVEYRIHCKDGSYRWVESNGRALRDEDGSVLQIVVITRDVTDRKRAESAITHSLVLEPAGERPESALRERVRKLERAVQKVALVLEEAGVAASIGERPLPADVLPALRTLSEREWEVLRRLLANRRVPVIARELCISPHTVRNHLKAIFRKLNVGSQSELIERLSPRS
jgi:PAS domain S-box-containing protein